MSAAAKIAEIQDRFFAQVDAAADAAQVDQRAQRRARLLDAIGEVAEVPALFERHRYFTRCLGGVVLSADEAVAELTRMVRLQKRRVAARHWAARERHLPSLVEALTFARFVRRFGAAELRTAEAA